MRGKKNPPDCRAGGIQSRHDHQPVKKRKVGYVC